MTEALGTLGVTLGAQAVVDKTHTYTLMASPVAVISEGLA